MSSLVVGTLITILFSATDVRKWQSILAPMGGVAFAIVLLECSPMIFISGESQTGMFDVADAGFESSLLVRLVVVLLLARFATWWQMYRLRRRFQWFGALYSGCDCRNHFFKKYRSLIVVLLYVSTLWLVSGSPAEFFLPTETIHAAVVVIGAMGFFLLGASIGLEFRDPYHFVVAASATGFITIHVLQVVATKGMYGFDLSAQSHLSLCVWLGMAVNVYRQKGPPIDGGVRHTSNLV